MQFSQALRALPVVAFVGLSQVPRHPLDAQTRSRVSVDDAWFYQQASGKRVARLLQGAVLAVGDTAGDWQAVTLDGWIFGASVGPTVHPGFDLMVTRAPAENLRATPAGTVLAKLPQGFFLSHVGDEHRWVHVQRAGWMQRSALQPIAAVASERTAAPDSAVAAAPVVGDSGLGGALRPAHATPLYRAPEGPQAGVIAPSTSVRVLSRTGEWSRVQVEGWVKTADLEASAPGVLVGVSAAELRADPDRYVGQTVRWTLQFLAIEQADELRPEMPMGATYLLTRGPLPEHSFAYVMVPDPKRALVQSLTPLALIDVTARVRVGRTRFLGNPVVELLTLEVQPQP